MKPLLLLIVLLLFCYVSHAQKQLWTSCFPDSASQYYPNDVAVDSSGNSYVTGYIQGTGNDYLLKHFYLLKNNSAGQLQWVNYYPVSDSFDIGTAVAADNNGNVYVTGQRYDTACNICTVIIPHSYSFTIKYNAAGKLIWLNKYDGPTSTNQLPAAIAVTSTGIVHTTGVETKYNPATSTNDQWMITQKISAAGSTLWVSKITDATGKGITIDRTGAAIATGAYVPNGFYQLSNLVTVKYKLNGDSAWYRKFSEYQKNGTGYVVKTDAANNVYVNGQTDTLAFYNNAKIITLKYTSTGTLLWSQKEEDQTYTAPHYYGGYTIDKNGNSYIAGYQSLSDINDNWLIVKRNAGGALVWSRQYDDSIHGSDKPSGGIVVDAAGNVTASGYASFQRNTPYTTVQYSAAGAQKWVAYYKRKTVSYNYPYGIGLDAQNNIYVGGNGYGEICMVKYNNKAASLADKAASMPLIASVSNPISSVRIVPNPVHNVLTLFTENVNVKYNVGFISDAAGTVLQRFNSMDNKEQRMSIDVSRLPAGIYLLHVTNGKAFYTQKFMKL